MDKYRYNYASLFCYDTCTPDTWLMYELLFFQLLSQPDLRSFYLLAELQQLVSVVGNIET